MMEHIVSCTRATYEESTLQAATDPVVQHTRLFSLNFHAIDWVWGLLLILFEKLNQ